MKIINNCTIKCMKIYRLFVFKMLDLAINLFKRTLLHDLDL